MQLWPPARCAITATTRISGWMAETWEGGNVKENVCQNGLGLLGIMQLLRISSTSPNAGTDS